MSEDPVAIAVADVIDVVAEHFSCTRLELRSQRRDRRVTHPRQIAMYLAWKLTEKSLPQIGDAIGGRDHTTVIHARDRIAEQLAANEDLKAEVTALEIAATTLGKLRAKGMLPQPGEALSPLQLARKVAANGQRAALRVTPDQVLELCDALLTLAESKALRDAARSDPESLVAAGIDPEAILAGTGDAPPRPIFDIVHDFVGAEAMLRQKRSRDLTRARADLVGEMRAKKDRFPAVAAFLAAYDAMVAAEYTPGERDATERYRKAVSALADAFLKSKEVANV